MNCERDRYSYNIYTLQSPMEFTKEQVEKLASLSKLRFTEEEIDEQRKHLTTLFSYIEVISEADVEGIEPTSQVTGLRDVTYADEPSKAPFSEGIEKRILESSNQPVEMKQIKVPNVL